MKKKIEISILLGFIYWLLIKAFFKFHILANIESYLLGIFLWNVIPFIAGFLLIYIINQRKFLGISYCIIFVTAYYIVELFQFILRVVPVYDSFDDAFNSTFPMHLSLFSSPLLFSLLSGLIAIYINRKRLAQVQAA